MKHLNLMIVSCGDCPYCVFDEDRLEDFVCSNQDSGSNSGESVDLESIPEWCPLVDYYDEEESE